MEDWVGPLPACGCILRMVFIYRTVLITYFPNTSRED
jgi:hypothetical protein